MIRVWFESHGYPGIVAITNDLPQHETYPD